MAGPLRQFAGFIWLVVNSSFGTALLGALAGAVAGALSAQRIATTVEHRKQIQDEFSTIIRSITLAYGITSFFLNMKEQHVRRMQEQYAQTCMDEIEFRVSKEQGFVASDAVFTFVADLSVLESPPISIDTLSKLILERTQSQRAVVFLILLSQSMENVVTILKKRSALIAEFKMQPRDIWISKYLGLPDERGNIDARFSGQIAELGSAVDGSIYFSMRLNDILTGYGKRILPKMKRAKLKLPSPNFDKAVAAELLPDLSDFQDHEDQLSAWKKEDQDRHARGIRAWLRRS